MNAPLPPDEAERLQALRRYAILDTPPDAAFDRLTNLAVRLFNVPIALVSLIDAERQWFKACYGLDTRQTGRDLAFCAHAILMDQVMVVPDAHLDARFVDNSLVTGPPYIRFYAGAPLRTADGFNLGTLCLLDTEPRTLSDPEIATLADLAAVVVDELELRRAGLKISEEMAQRRQTEAALQRAHDELEIRVQERTAELRLANAALHQTSDQLRAVLDAVPGGVSWISSDLKYLGINRYLAGTFGLAPEDFVGREVGFLQNSPDFHVFARRFFAGAAPTQTAEIGMVVNGSPHTYLMAAQKYLQGEAAVCVGVDITARRQTEAALETAHHELELRVQERTAELADVVEVLRGEIDERRRVEATLRQTARENDQLAVAVANLSTGVSISDPTLPDNPIIFVNPAFTAMTGYTADEALGHNCRFLQGPETDAQTLREIRAAMDERRTFQGVILNYRKDGTRFWNELTISPVFDDAGTLLNFVGLQSDVTARKQAEEALQASEKRYSSLFENNHTVMLLVDPETGDIVDANPAACAFYGYSHDDLSNRKITDLNTLSSEQIFQDMGRARLVQQSHFSFCHRLADGTMRDVDVYSGPIEVHGKQLLYSIIHDVSEHRLAEAALRQSEARKAAILQAALDAIITFDHAGNIIEFNPAAEQIFGYTQAEAKGQELVALIIPPSLRQNHRDGIAHYLATGEGPLLGRRLEVTAMRADGSEFPVELTITPIASDGPPLFTGHLRDITERRQAEAAVRQSEERFRQIAENIREVFWINAVDGTGIVYISPAYEDIWGRTRESLYQSPASWSEAIHPEDRPRVQEAARSKQIQGTYDEEYRIVRPDGSIRWVQDRAFPVRNDKGEVYRVAGISHDITERKWAEAARQQATDEAERANRAKSEFLSRMSHELRTPLNAILGFTQLMAMDERPQREQQNLEHILKAGQHLLGLINEVLEITRIETGHVSFSIEPVLVYDAAQEMISLVRSLAAGQQVQLRDVESCNAYVLADRQRLKQVLLNLLSNAVKYNRAGGSVALSCVLPDSDAMSGRDAMSGGEGMSDGGGVDGATAPPHLRIRVTDTGHGIAPEQLDRLFTPFDRLGAEQRGIEGTGIGLALSKRLIEAMGGTITVESTVGQGSTFTVELPTAVSPLHLAQDPSEDADQTTGSGPSANGKARTILYIEDNLPNMELIEHILSPRQEIRLLAAMQGGIGLELAREHHLDLILLDLHLPDMEGDEVLRRLRAEPRTRDIPVIVLSADATPGRIERLLAAGARAYLTKPLQVRQFLLTLEEVLGEDEH